MSQADWCRCLNVNWEEAGSPVFSSLICIHGYSVGFLQQNFHPHLWKLERSVHVSVVARFWCKACLRLCYVSRAWWHNSGRKTCWACQAGQDFGLYWPNMLRYLKNVIGGFSCVPEASLKRKTALNIVLSFGCYTYFVYRTYHVKINKSTTPIAWANTFVATALKQRVDVEC